VFNLKGAKEIIVKLNKDKTYNVTVKCDSVSKENGIVNETEIIYPRAEIINFDIDVLITDDGELFSFTDKN
jgi:hypothetical protein